MVDMYHPCVSLGRGHPDTLVLLQRMPSATHLGPGAFFKDKPFVTPPPASQQQPLYRMERDVNPTRVASVQRFYDASRATNVGGVLLERAGNAVASMKSAAPRFQPPQNDTSDATTQLRRGPGAYSPEKVRSHIWSAKYTHVACIQLTW